MKEIEIKLTGSGTPDEIATHLIMLAQSLEDYPKGWVTDHWEDPYIYVEVTKL